MNGKKQLRPSSVVAPLRIDDVVGARVLIAVAVLRLSGIGQNKPGTTSRSTNGSGVDGDGASTGQVCKVGHVARLLLLLPLLLPLLKVA